MSHRFDRREFLFAGAAIATSALAKAPVSSAGVSDTLSTLYIDDSDPTIDYGASDWAPVMLWTIAEDMPGRSGGTAHSTDSLGAFFVYTHSQCNRLIWYATTDVQSGQADVYIDGTLSRAGVDLYSDKPAYGVAVFDSGLIPVGPHTLKVVVAGSSENGRGTKVELDRLCVSGDARSLPRISHSNLGLIHYAGSILGWLTAMGPNRFVTGPVLYGSDAHYSGTQGDVADFTFKGSQVRWIGRRLPDGGLARVYIDGQLETIVDTYSPTPQVQQCLFEKKGLSTEPKRFHTIRLEVARKKSRESRGYYVYVEAFECEQPVDAPAALKTLAVAELARIKAGAKPYLPPTTWHPKPYVASMPTAGVALLPDVDGVDGPFRTAFQRNIEYLNHCFAQPNYVEPSTALEQLPNFWINEVAASNEGRLLMGAGHALRWGERSDLRRIVDTIVSANKARQRADGYVMPWPEISFAPAQLSCERANYDRAHWTRGMVAAILAGNSDAGKILRRFYDWFNASPYPFKLLEGKHGFQGHIGSTLTFHSPVGVPDDMIVAERSYVQDWLLTQLKYQEPLSFYRYPFYAPHSYLIVVLESYLDHFRATGAQKYLDAALGGWEMFRRDYIAIGGGTAIVEGLDCPPQSFQLPGLQSEFDGAIFWIHFNHRLLQLYPDQEKYATEIERCLYNVALAQQESAAPHRIRYAALVHEYKAKGTAINTCCEVNGSGLFSQLPQFLYSLAKDGLYVNMWESSRVNWSCNGRNVALTTATRCSRIRSIVVSFDRGYEDPHSRAFLGHAVDGHRGKRQNN